MKGPKRLIQHFGFKTNTQCEPPLKSFPKRVFLGMRLKGDLEVLCPVLKMERENEHTE
jgi:hypothetical protein